MARVAALLAACAVALALATAARAFTKTDGAMVMDDGVTVATSLYVPDGTPPASGWPAILMFHGLGGSRRDMNALAELWYVPRGYAVATYDARGHGASGGVVNVDGPREIADAKAAFDWLASQPGIDRSHIGGWGVSYGGGAVWRATVEGVPFAAIETFETWTDLYHALVPNNLSKSGVVFGFLNEIAAGKAGDVVTAYKADLLASTNLDRIANEFHIRSTLPELSNVTTPAFMFQGRRDFAFDMAQMTRAYVRLKGPKRLYLGNLGHAPSTFIADDFPYFMGQSALWFDRYLKGMPNGIDTKPPVEVAPSPFRGKAVAYKGLPPVNKLVLSFPGKTTIDENGKVIRTIALPNQPLEHFGSPVVSANLSATAGFERIVAVLTAITPQGKELLLDDGGIKFTLGPTARTIRFALESFATPIPKGSKLRLTMASNSAAQDPRNLVYLQVPGTPGAKLTVGPVKVTLPVLRTPISK